MINVKTKLLLQYNLVLWNSYLANPPNYAIYTIVNNGFVN